MIVNVRIDAFDKELRVKGCESFDAMQKVVEAFRTLLDVPSVEVRVSGEFNVYNPWIREFSNVTLARFESPNHAVLVEERVETGGITRYETTVEFLRPFSFSVSYEAD